MMIERYTSPGMAAVWGRPRQLMYLYEAAVLAAGVTDVEHDLGGNLTRGVTQVRDAYRAALGDEAAYQLGVGLVHDQLDRWELLEDRFDHDIAAFVELVRADIEAAGSQVSRYFHLGRTSSDLVDTALAFAMIDARELIEDARAEMLRQLAYVALRYSDTPILGRTHGQTAEFTTVGRRFALAADAISHTPWPVYRFAKLTGPVGVRSNQAAGLGLAAAGLTQLASTQIVPRVELARAMGEIATATVPVSQLATLIRLGSRDEADSWVREGKRGSAARGSSSMPTKRNPIRSERAAGLCTWVRSTTGTVTESVSALWEERDISHSSVERISLPAIHAVMEFVYSDMATVVHGLEVDPPRATKPAGGLRVTPAYALELLVSEGALSYTEAYNWVRAYGPQDALAWAGLDREAYGRGYEPGDEPALWELMHTLAGL